MALQGQWQVVQVDAGAVVFDADAAHTTSHQAHRDLAGPGVQRVVHQLAHGSGRPVDDFTGGDLADQLVGQLLDAPPDHWDDASGRP